jgi:rare lipoprotein A
MKLAAVCISVFCVVPVIVSCAGKAPLPAVTAAIEPPAPASTPAPALAHEQVYRETGTASWYGREFHGRRTADGGTFDGEGLSAAHRTLPLGTAIRVTNLDNYKTIDVKVSDRGPFVRGRILELSYGAARALDFVREGTARVKIEALAPVRSDGVYTVQAAVFVEEENAKTLKGRLQAKYETVYIVPGETNLGTFYRVRVGLYPSEEKAERIAAKLALDGLEPVVVRKD